MRQISSKEDPDLFTTMSSSGAITNGNITANGAGAGVAPTAPAVEYHNPSDDTTLSRDDDNINTTLDDVWGDDGDNDNDDNDDVWGDDDDSHSNSHSHSHSHAHENCHHEPAARRGGRGGHGHPSDVPRLRQEHTTAGYRDGITVAKAEHVQAGFDEGFGLGATIGAVAGQLLGVLEGLSFAAVSSSSSKSKSQQTEDDEEESFLKEKLRSLLAEAEKDLAVTSIYGKEYWDEDGTWRYEVPGESKAQHERYQHPELHQDHHHQGQQQRQGQTQAGRQTGKAEEEEEAESGREGDVEEEEGEILFPDVALAHPLIKKWDRIIREELAERFGLVWDVALLLPRSEEDEHDEEHGHGVAEERKDAKPLVKAGSQALAW